MPRRDAFRALFAIYVVALFVRAITAATLRNPGYFDAFGYESVAANLHEGRGLTEGFVWSYIDASPVARALPHPSHLYWMPLTSLLAWLGMAALPWLAPFAGSQVPFVLLSALLPPIAAVIAFQCFRSRAYAIDAALLALFAPAYFDRWVVSEPVAPFAIAATAAFVLVAAPSPRRAAIAGIFAAIACLCRADGILVVLVAGCMCLLDRPPRKSAAVLVATFALAMTPWWLRQLRVAGTIAPGAGITTAFFRDYDDMFAFDQRASLATFLDQGPVAVVRGRLEAFVQNVGELESAFQIVLIPAAIVGYRTLPLDLRRRARPAAIYAAALFAFMTFVTPYPARFGSLYRSSAALVPWISALAPAGIAALATAYARLRNHDEAAARRVIGRAFAVAFVVLAAVAHCREVGVLASGNEPWNARLEHYRAIDAWLAERGDHAPVLTTNPPAFTYATKRASIMTPTDGPLAAVHASDAYGANYVILESNLRWAEATWRAGGEIAGFRRVRDFADAAGAPARVYERVR